MNIARIDRATMVVTNIEVADQEWIDQNSNDEFHLFIPFQESDQATVGGVYETATGIFTPLPAGLPAPMPEIPANDAEFLDIG